MKATKEQLAKINVLINQLGWKAHKADLAFTFTEGQSESTKDLTVSQAGDLIRHLENESKKSTEKTPVQKMRSKAVSLFIQLNWLSSVKASEAEWQKVNKFCKDKFGREFNKLYDEQTLNNLLNALESIQKKDGNNTKRA